nr:MAG TPA: hypothetical protein [Caudoviricetes sp.]
MIGFCTTCGAKAMTKMIMKSLVFQPNASRRSGKRQCAEGADNNKIVNISIQRAGLIRPRATCGSTFSSPQNKYSTPGGVCQGVFAKKSRSEPGRAANAAAARAAIKNNTHAVRDPSRSAKPV